MFTSDGASFLKGLIKWYLRLVLSPKIRVFFRQGSPWGSSGGRRSGGPKSSGWTEKTGTGFSRTTRSTSSESFSSSEPEARRVSKPEFTTSGLTSRFRETSRRPSKVWCSKLHGLCTIISIWDLFYLREPRANIRKARPSFFLVSNSGSKAEVPHLLLSI